MSDTAARLVYDKFTEVVADKPSIVMSRPVVAQTQLREPAAGPGPNLQPPVASIPLPVASIRPTDADKLFEDREEVIVQLKSQVAELTQQQILLTCRERLQEKVREDVAFKSVV